MTSVEDGSSQGDAVRLTLAHLRQEYMRGGLRKEGMHPEPIRQFTIWFEQALAAGITEPNAMVLATADAQSRPSTRVVLLKEVTERGFTFFTNYESRKGRELAVNRQASVTFPWVALERQVCICGVVSKVSREVSEAYFRLRPRGSRIGAWVSRQSSVVSGRAELEAKAAELEKRYPSEDIPLPDYWGGYVLEPTEIEFWQGRPNRLHDRIRYLRAGDNKWNMERLSP
jgi:pyridoxamine 5'-phosphate oxidase